MDRKKKSGAENRKIQAAKKAEALKNTQPLTTFGFSSQRASNIEDSESESLDIEKEVQSANITEQDAANQIVQPPCPKQLQSAVSQSITLEEEPKRTNSQSENDETHLQENRQLPEEPLSTSEAEVINVDISDIANWPEVITHNLRTQIIETGPIQVMEKNLPKTNGRKFKIDFYAKSMPNKEVFKREWLIYSVKLDAVHCFCCFLFDDGSSHSAFRSNQGFKDWKHLGDAIKAHETSQTHFTNYQSWKMLANSVRSGKSIDDHIANAIKSETERLRAVFQRLIAFILYLSRQNIPFLGRSTGVDSETSNNGNFIQLVKTVAEFDLILKQHLEKQNGIHYLSPQIQNELVNLIGDKVRKAILDDIIKSKYYAVILDCTPDTSNKEQMTIVYRYVHFNQSEKRYEIKESFIEFVKITDKTGVGIAAAYLERADIHQIDFNDARGLGFDNGSNMRGKRIGAKTVLMAKNPRAFFVPCSTHTLNLAVNDAASASDEINTFFSKVQRLYTFLHASTNRWDIVAKHIKPNELMPKEVCETRWSSRIDAIKPLHRNLNTFLTILKEIHTAPSFDNDTAFSAELIINSIDYKFILSICVWNEVLYQLNLVSKALQGIKMDVDGAIKSLEGVLEFLENYKSNGFENVTKKADEIAKECSIATTFETRGRKLRKDGEIVPPKDAYKSNHFNFLIDVTIESITERFIALSEYQKNFSFLCKLGDVEESYKSGQLLQSCVNLQNVLASDGKSDIDAHDLQQELVFISSVCKNHEIEHPIDILNIIAQYELENMVPNAVIAYRILLTIPVSVSSAERSFSKLKLIKTYLRSTMSEERLNSLSILSIEHETANQISYDEIINAFAAKKARRLKF